MNFYKLKAIFGKLPNMHDEPNLSSIRGCFCFYAPRGLNASTSAKVSLLPTRAPTSFCFSLDNSSQMRLTFSLWAASSSLTCYVCFDQCKVEKDWKSNHSLKLNSATSWPAGPPHQQRSFPSTHYGVLPEEQSDSPPWQWSKGFWKFSFRPVFQDWLDMSLVCTDGGRTSLQYLKKWYFDATIGSSMNI